MRPHDFNFNNRTMYGIKSDTERYIWAGYFLFVILSSLIGDTIILIASIKFKAFKLHKVMVIIIQHIAVSDLIHSLIYLVPRSAAIIADGWAIGDTLCYVNPYTMYIANSSGALLICSMTFTKLFTLKYPLKSNTMSSKKAHLICIAAWAMSPSFPIMNFLVDMSDVSFDFRNYVCDFRNSSNIWKWLTPVTSVLFLVIPNCLVITTTVSVLIIAKRVAERGRQSLKWQGITTTVLTATVYCISVLPYAVYRIGESVIDVDDKSKSFFYTTFYRLASSFYSLNTISNFYIYSLTVSSFREFLKSGTRRRQSYQKVSLYTSSSRGIVKIVHLINKFDLIYSRFEPSSLFNIKIFEIYKINQIIMLF